MNFITVVFKCEKMLKGNIALYRYAVTNHSINVK